MTLQKLIWQRVSCTIKNIGTEFLIYQTKRKKKEKKIEKERKEILRIRFIIKRYIRERLA